MTTHVDDPQRSIPAKNPRVPFFLGGGVLLVLALGGVLFAEARSRENDIPLASEPKGVTVVAAKSATYRPEERFVGTVEAWNAARIGPQMVSAYVGTVLVRPGDAVKRGDVLATLDCKAASAQSMVIAAQARGVEQRQKAAASEAARLSQLSQGGFVSANELEQRQSQVASNLAQLDALRAQMAGKSLEVNDCTLRAPFDGEVGDRFVDPGAFVKPGSTVVTLVDRRLLRVIADVPEIAVAAVAKDTPVRIHMLSSGVDVEGRVARRSPSADPVSRTVHFEVDLDPNTAAAPVGTTAELRVEVGVAREAIEIPLNAAKVRGKNASLFVVDHGIAKATSADVLGERGGSLFLAKTLPAGALVVKEGRAKLIDGDKVEAKLQSDAPAAPSVPAAPAPSAGATP